MASKTPMEKHEEKLATLLLETGDSELQDLLEKQAIQKENRKLSASDATRKSRTANKWADKLANAEHVNNMSESDLLSLQSADSRIEAMKANIKAEIKAKAERIAKEKAELLAIREAAQAQLDAEMADLSDLDLSAVGPNESERPLTSDLDLS